MAYARGEQRPSKYPKTGPKYERWGEQTQAGLVYDPETDTYHQMSPEERIAHEKELNPQPKVPGIYEQAGAQTIPALASTAGLIAINEALKPAAAQTGAEVVKDVIAANAAKEAAAQGVATPQMVSAQAVPATESSGILGPSGYLNTGEVAASDVLGAIAAAKGSYDAYKGYMRGGKGMRTGLTELGAGIGTMLMPGVGTVAGAAAGNIAGYGLQGNGIKNDLALAAISLGLLGAKKLGLTSHKTTKQYQQERRGNLAARGLLGLQQFEDASAARNGAIIRDPNFQGESAYDYVSSLGNYETFGDDWDKYDLATKAKIAKGLMDAGLYRNDHGDTLIWHGLGEGGDQARAIRDQILSGQLVVDPGENPYYEE